MFALGFAAAALLVGGDNLKAPELRRTAEGSLIIDTPGEKADRTFQVRMDLARSGDMTVAQQLERILVPEPYRIVAADDRAGTATIITSAWGSWILANNNHHWSSIKVAAVAPVGEPRPSPSCQRAMVSLDRNPKDAMAADLPTVFRDENCPRAERLTPLEHIVLEGRSANGETLWLTHAPDLRFVRGESARQSGEGQLDFAGHVEESILTASFTAPVTPQLATVRWFEVTRDEGLKWIGDSAWPEDMRK